MGGSALLWGVMHTHGPVKAEPTGKTGYMYAIGELSKARMKRVEDTECVTEGAKRCKLTGEWD